MMNGHDVNGHAVAVQSDALEQAERRVLAASPADFGNILHNTAGHLAAIGVQGSDIVRRLKGAANQAGAKGGAVYDMINAGIRDARQHPQAFVLDGDEEFEVDDQAEDQPAADDESAVPPKVQKARAVFHGAGGRHSWARVVRGAAAGKELNVLEMATRETLALARKAEINEIDVIDFFYELADAQGITAEYGPDAVQAAFARARSATPTVVPLVPKIETATATVADEPIPLIPELAPPASYPAGALGAVLGEAAVSIARKVQCPVEIAAQSVLAVASLAAQAHADVLMPFGQTRPLSLFLFSIALSSDRKTSADYEALTPIRDRERDLGDHYGLDLEQARMSQAAWQGEHKKIEGNKKLGYVERIGALKELGREPELPLHPILTAPEPTVEGLIKMWPHAPASLGLFSAEGGQLIGGHSMSEDNRLKTAAAYSELWDGRPVRRVRAGDGVTLLNGRRFALHIMVQPEAAQAFLSDSLLRSQGLLSRILIASPPTMAGTRFYRLSDEHDSSSIRAYSRVIGRLLEMPWPLADGKRNELLPRVLRCSSDAVEVWREFHDHIEGRSGPGSELAAVREFAGKAAEHAARIAGVLAIVADPGAQEIGAATMRDAAALVEWYVGESQRLAAAAMTDPKIARAQRLLEWTRARTDAPADGISIRWITRHAPTELRTKDTAENAVAVLANHGWFREAGKPKRWSLVEGVRS